MVKFDEKQHKYTRGTRDMTSVTKFISQFFPEFDVKKIARRVAKYRREKGELNDKGKPITANDVKREWKQIASTGSLVHKELEDYATNSSELESIVDVFHKKSQCGVNFLKNEVFGSGEYMDLDPEVIVDSASLGLAGTIDLRVSYTNSNGERLVDLIDWKTNDKLEGSYGRIKKPPLDHFNISNSKLDKYYLQLNLYKRLLEMKGASINNMFIVHLKDDGYKKYEVPDMSSVVDGMLLWADILKGGK